jgi:hypothetical protein
MATSQPTQDAAHVIDVLPLDALLTVNMFIVRHLIRVYHAFDGDLLEAIVLGEVAHHNVSSYLAATAEARRKGAESMVRVPPPADYLPTNAFSIAQSTGIPRQTVRRKVKNLVARGWLLETKAGLIVSHAPFEHFRDFNQELATDVLSTLNTVLRLTHAAAGEQKQPVRDRR